MGTPPADVTTAIDMWSVGCVLAFAVTGQHLFPARTQVGMIFSILRQRGGEPTGDLETLPCWPEQPPRFSRPRPWPGRLPEVLGPVGELLLGQVLSLSPRARPSARDCLAHMAMQTPWPIQDQLAQPVLGNPPDQRRLELWAAGGNSQLQGGRGPWRLRRGQVAADLLDWLRSGAPFIDPAAQWAHSGWSWTGAGANWYSELGRKLQIAGKLGSCAGSSLLQMSLSQPFPSLRMVAFRRAFMTLNGAALDRLHDLLLAALPHSLDSGPNAEDLRGHPRDWLATQSTLQFYRAGEAFQEPWHWDGGASLLHLGFTLWGERELTARLADNSEVQLPQRPGWVYLSNLTSFEHQVSHPPRTQASQLLNIPGHGECGVSVMMRTSLFRSNRARTSRHKPTPLAVFRAATQAVVDWLEANMLELPSLAQCVAAAEDGGPHG